MILVYSSVVMDSLDSNLEVARVLDFVQVKDLSRTLSHARCVTLRVKLVMDEVQPAVGFDILSPLASMAPVALSLSIRRLYTVVLK